jgi:hypothetical protein
MEEPKISKEEFQKKLEEFFQWTASYDRPMLSWFSSLCSWSDQEFNREYERIYPPKEKK